MCERNVELERRWIEAFNARDIEAYVALCDPSIELHPMLEGAVGGAVYQGHDGMRQLHRDLEDAWEEFRIEPEAYFDFGQYTLTFFVFHGRGRQSGVQVVMPGTAVTTWRDGLTLCINTYVRREDALRDLGVPEDELGRIER
jgi:hypothetical protein